ncbi:WYL domain-containing protein [Nocardioides panacisoli]|uniref:helix-turn-helix transcriptional regulator n=1 Tax=Nocardioides panacisoli TaxID=627624 RepID=UPI001C631C4B|nr:WYL domain-containing protein [Nocardioides panacisoli]QYJ05058.1 WYL domain-containing protein [Nocardioides panacisoli]
MAVPKSERLMKLLIMLLVQRRPLGKHRIREHLYPGSGAEAFEKMFERDKEELRALGVPIETAPLDAYFDDEVGYRIPPGEFALPEVSLTAEEAAVVGLATRTWHNAGMTQATSAAVRKLTAAGVEVDLGALDMATPSGSAEESLFATCWEALCERQPVEFDYQRSGETTVRRRHLQPWGVLRYRGRWYVVGHDTDRGAERLFRLSRVHGNVVKVRRPGSYDIPEDVDVGEVARRMAPRPVAERAVLLVRQGAGHVLRRGARVVEDVPGPDAASGWDRVELDQPIDGLVEDVLAHGADVLLVEPVELRERIVARLDATLAGSPA